ncbi:hypothetical protein EWM64_g4326 [Hericium alpestre]|uniref:F-box domain-containing protein n=1 Tax=Hericium alpestre TaxID=135208 RepID=A0A4Z0A1U9_9AGAM|nr:hypothetical protein EWM64_g4326 [Hericium alpestre]
MSERIPWIDAFKVPNDPWEEECRSNWWKVHDIRASREETEQDFLRVYGHLLKDTDEPATYKCSTTVVLPSELLVKIFSCLTKHDPPRIRETFDASRSHIVTAPYFGWINVTYVCHSWKRLTICAADLWTDLGHGLVLGPSWTKEFLLRARWANVSIPSFKRYSKVFNMLSDWIPAHCSHICDITISGHYQLAAHIVHKPCPELVSADIDSGEDCGLDLPDLCHGLARRLRYLRLYNVMAWRSPGDWRGLVEVEVHIYGAWRRGQRHGSNVSTTKNDLRPSLAEVVDALEVLAPTLERLGLHFSLPSYVPCSAPALHKVHLACLKYMALSAEAMSIAQFLGHVDFPPKTLIDMTCIPDESEGLGPIYGLLAERMSSSEGLEIDLARIELGSGRYEDNLLISVYAFEVAIHAQLRDKLLSLNTLTGRKVEPILKLSLAYAWNDDYIDAAVEFFKTLSIMMVPLQNMPYREVHRLILYGSCHVDAEGWHTITRGIFPHLRSIRLLALGQDAAQCFFHAIHDETSRARRKGIPTDALPNLFTLILCNIDVSLFAPDWQTDRTPFKDQLLIFLQDQKDCRHQLRALVFISPKGLDETWVAKLRQVVSPGVVTIGF